MASNWAVDTTGAPPCRISAAASPAVSRKVGVGGSGRCRAQPLVFNPGGAHHVFQRQVTVRPGRLLLRSKPHGAWARNF
jgi:hypothetical protein